MSHHSLCALARLLLEPVKILDAPAELLQAIAFGLAEPLQTFNLAVDGICNGIVYKSDDWPHMTYFLARKIGNFTFLPLGHRNFADLPLELLLRDLYKVLTPLDLHIPPSTSSVALQDSIIADMQAQTTCSLTIAWKES